MTDILTPVFVDGEPLAPEAATISVLDIGFQRGYGCFEAMRAYDGVVFRLEQHLDRLRGSAAALHISLPDDAELTSWSAAAAELAGGDSVVRLFVSGGVDIATPGTGSSVIVFAEMVPEDSGGLTVEPRPAPWHPDGEPSEMTGVKSLSYGPNLAASLAAHRAGYGDALLIGRSGTVLEGPTFSIGWVSQGKLFTPSLDLGILASITRAAALEVAESLPMAVEQGRFPLDAVLGADEVIAMSTVKEVMPVTSVGTTEFAGGPVTADLAAGFADLVQAEVG
jgi:branched-subunit amino acid aminotransferase/4-amino-4-deoxychorismate lyase